MRFPLINAVLLNLQDGIIFRDVNTQFSFILHKSGFSYINKKEHDCLKLLQSITNSAEVPGYFHVYDPAQELITACELETKAINIKLRKRVQLKFLSKELSKKFLPPAGYKTEKIDTANFELLSVFNLSLDNKFWRSKEDFLANGFGFIVINDNCDPVSICYTACVADKIAEIDVATIKGYQNKGLAKIVVGAFIEHCLKENIIANWDCFEENDASLKTAESLGFGRVMNYSFLSIFNKRK